MRWLWGTVGALGLALAVVGTVLPVMPTVPFLLVAAFGFARSSPAWHDWLMEHPQFGRMIVDWQKHRAIRGRVKLLALSSMAAGLVMGAFVLPRVYWLAEAAVMAVIAIYIATRPAPPSGAVTPRAAPSP